MTWMRDPGADPEELLHLLERAYKGSSLKVKSADFDEIAVGNMIGASLEMQYSFQGHEAEKRFAAWRSDPSDRLFVASCQSSNGGDRSEVEKCFKSALETFYDRDAMRSLPSREVNRDAWSRVLQDVLSSRSYARPVPLPAGSVSIQVYFTGGLEDDVYQIVSEDVFTVRMPEEVYVRPAAVQEFLQNQGYQVCLVQNRGRVSLAVIDPQGYARAVSVSVAQPQRMVGVLLEDGGSDWLKGTVYSDLEKMATANSLHLSIPPGYLEERCQPSRYVELSMAKEDLDPEWVDCLARLLQGHSYTDYYQDNVFDCSNTSQICWAILRQNGYDSRLMVSYQGHPLEDHMWVVVRVPGSEERYLAVEATTTRGREIPVLGRIERKEQYYYGVMYDTSVQYSMLHPEDGMWASPDI